MPEIVRYGPGSYVSDPRPGDVILVHGFGWLGRCILGYERICCRRREDRALVHWSHAALVVSSAGHLIEAIPTGVVMGRLRVYRDKEYHYVRLPLRLEERKLVVDYARSCLKQKYGCFGFALLMLRKLLGGRVRVPDWGQQGCVNLIVRALQHAGVPFDRRPTDMSVSDLARYFGATP